MIKHISFDLWYTIIKSNPEFGNERNKAFYSFLNEFHPVEICQIELAHKKVKKICDVMGEISGVGLTQYQLYCLFLEELLPNLKQLFLQNPSIIDILILINSSTLKKYPPLLISENEIHSTLNVLSKTCSLSVLSNTSFADSKDLNWVLDFYNLNQYFDFTIFSDEIGYFKPHSKCFHGTFYHKKCLAEVREQILHVGDNQYADIQGAEKAGMKALLFSPSNPNYEDIFTIIENEK